MSNPESMTKKDFLALPHRKWNEEVYCDSIVIIPLRSKHDSGFRCIDFAAVVGNEATVLLSGCSDVVHIDGIGGYGDRWVDKYNRVPKVVPPTGWNIDFLGKSGLARIWPNEKSRIKVGPALSSFEIYAVPREEALSGSQSSD